MTVNRIFYHINRFFHKWLLVNPRSITGLISISYLSHVVAWVNRCTFSPPSPPPSSHHQLFVSLRYRKCRGAWVFRCDAILF